MRQLGFPQNSSLYPGKAYIYRSASYVRKQMFEPHTLAGILIFAQFFLMETQVNLMMGSF